MVPGMTEREFHALELIRREWLDGELTRRPPATAGRRGPVGPGSRQRVRC